MTETVTLVAKTLCILAMMPTAIVEASIVREAFKAIGRNPKLEETIFPKVIISIALVESTAIYSLVAFFSL